MDDVAGPDVDHHQPAARLGVARRQVGIQPEPGEGAVVAALRQADDGEIAGERQAAQIAGTEGRRLEPSRPAIDGAEMAGPRFQQPQPAVVHPRRVRHRQAVGEDFAAGDVDDHAAVVAAIAPAVGDVAAADRGDVAERTVLDGEPVEMAAVLRRQFADERRRPQRAEARPLADRGDAAEQGVDEQRPAVAVDGDVVDVEIAGGVGDPGHVEAIGAVVDPPRRQRVLEPPQLVERAHPQRIPGRAQPHAARERAFEDRQPPVRLQPDQEQLAGLIGGERQAQPAFRQPRRELPGRGQHHLRRRRPFPRLARHRRPSRRRRDRRPYHTPRRQASVWRHRAQARGHRRDRAAYEKQTAGG